ncbi:MAG: hypothetical protein U0W24_20090 [Bacteroidales bacterium]
MKTIHQLSSLNLIKSTFILLALAIALTGFTGCKSKKKVVTEDPKNNQEQVNTELIKAKSTITELLSDDCTKTLEEKEKILGDIKGQNLKDEELNSLIAQLESKIAKEKEQIRIAEEKAKEDAKPENKLRKYFDGIASAPDEATANALIQEALNMFVSDQANVLIIISQENNMKDYDKPTKIGKYLNYLKDTKNNINDIDQIHWEGNKIKTLELKKK